MQFLAKDLKKFFNSMQNHRVNQISIKSKKLEITVNRQGYIINQIQNKSIINAIKLKNETKKIKKNNQNQIGLKVHASVNRDQHEAQTYSTIISPMVGTFYQSPGPNEAPFIKKGDCVDKKQTVCIIEAMKLMNEIEAEVTGEIVEILVNDGDVVDCGQALMKVKL